MITRREFLDTLTVSGAGLAITSTAKSYGHILGSNDKLNFVVIGLHSRVYAHFSSLKPTRIQLTSPMSAMSTPTRDSRATIRTP